jgi:starvation-inducible outer membrane lipoprotein
MQWINDREKELGAQLGFVVRKGGRTGGQIVNISFQEKDADHNSPLQTTARPATTTEAKLWRLLMQAEKL